MTFLAAGTALCAAGCSLIGLSIGALSDKSSQARRTPVPGWAETKLEPGNKVEAHLRDGRLVAGQFVGVKEEPQKRYAERYDLARALPGVELPALGEGAQLRRGDGTTTSVELVGFGVGRAYVRLPGVARTSWLPLESVASLLDRDGREFSGPGLSSLMAAGRVPISQSLVMDTASGQERFPADTVDRVDIVHGKKGKQIGFLIGLAIDVTVVAVAASSDSSSHSSSCEGSAEGCQSCPFVYSFDGTGFVLDAEPFGGSFAEAAQRSDWSLLDHLREVGGQYRLRVSNELKETDHLDEVRLIVVDHPDDAQVVPDLYGHFLTLTSPAAPSAARDLRGANVLDLVARRDDRDWLGNPFGRDPGKAADLRDGLEVEFPRPPSAREAVLAIRGRSTPWFPALIHRVLDLPGRERAAWYDGLSSPRGQRSLYHLASEAFPIVRVWTGNEWRAVDFLAELPTVTYGAQGVRLDLEGLPPDVLRIRIDGLPGTWAVDEVKASFGNAATAQVTELPAISALAAGQDVGGTLRATDRERQVVGTGERLDLVFAAPARRPGLSRSFVLKASGYYQIAFREDAEPQPVLFEKLLSEPDALARYSLELLREAARQGLAE